MSPLLNSRIIYDYDAEKKKKKCEEENRTQKIPGNDIMSTKTNIFATVATLSVMREKRRSLRYDKNWVVVHIGLVDQNEDERICRD